MAAVNPALTDNYLHPADSIGMRDVDKERVVKLVRRRDGTRELKTPRPLDSMDAAFAAIAELARAR